MEYWTVDDWRFLWTMTVLFFAVYDLCLTRVIKRWQKNCDALTSLVDEQHKLIERTTALLVTMKRNDFLMDIWLEVEKEREERQRSRQ